MGSQHSSRVNMANSEGNTPVNTNNKNFNFVNSKAFINSFSQINDYNSNYDGSFSVGSSMAASRSCSSYSFGSEKNSRYSNKDKKNKERNNKKSDESNKDINIPTNFVWDKGGKQVILYGSFSNWEERTEMEFDPTTNTFSSQFILPKGIYQFRFLVDGQWKTSDHYQTVEASEGVMNNIIDNLLELKKLVGFQNGNSMDNSRSNSISNSSQNNSHSPSQFSESSQNSKTSSVGQSENNSVKKKTKKVKLNESIQSDKKRERNNEECSKNKTKSHSKSKSRSKISYEQKFPKPSELTECAPLLPAAYENTITFNLDDERPLEGKNYKVVNRFIKSSIYEYENDSYKNSTLPYHVTINHLLSKCEQYENFYTLNSTLRIGRKFCTVIFCQPYGDSKSMSSIPPNNDK